MSITKNLMITLTEAEIEQLEKLSNSLGCSKTRVISQALNLLKSELERANFGEFQGKNASPGGENAIH